jgi:hypothetical protein
MVNYFKNNGLRFINDIAFKKIIYQFSEKSKIGQFFKISAKIKPATEKKSINIILFIKSIDY